MPSVFGVQLRALLWKNWLLKRRSPRTALFELLLPVGFMTILLFGYELSEVEVFGAGVYNGRYINTTVVLGAFGGADGLGDVGALGGGSGGSAGLGGGGAVTTGDLVRVRSTLDAVLNGPLPVPTIEQYVRLHELTRNLTESVQNELLSQNRFGRLFGNVLTLGTIHLSPQSPAVSALAEYLEAQADAPDTLRVRIHADEPAAVEYILANTQEQTWALLHFGSLQPCAVNYTVRVNYTTVPNTWSRVRLVARGLDTNYQKYLLSGVLTLQRAVHGFVLHLADPASAERILSGEPPDGPADAGEPLAGAPLIPMPTARYSQNIFYRAVGYLMGFFMAIALMYPVSQLTRAIVEEKEARLRQTLRCMGLRYDALVSAWLLTGAAQFTLTATFVTAVICSTFVANSNPLLIFLWVETFLLSTVSLSLLMSTAFSRAKLAAVAAPMLYVAAVVPKFAFFATDRNERVAEKLLTSLLSPSAFAFGADFVADYEYAEVGVTAATASSEPFSFAATIGMMALDAVLYLLAALYLDQTVPTQYGAPRHPLFCLPARARAALARVPVVGPRLGAGEADAGGAGARAPALDPLAAEEVAAAAPPVVEEDTASGGAEGAAYDGVYVSRLLKVYGSGAARKVAVKGVSVGMLRGRITCLLGHNGAGKTSLISVLTGLYPPTDGDCFAFGQSISHQREEVYRLLGLCPQHDVLFGRLSVAEHLELFAAIKGSVAPAAAEPARAQQQPPAGGESGAEADTVAFLAAHGGALPVANPAQGVADARAEAEPLLLALGLGDKARTHAYALSGGMKRKLSVALALVARSRAVLLDEPTSGMDPHSRRATWELLQAHKASRSLVLTTHYMDEADLLADRIAVLADGHLQAFGSSLFLKTQFGLGYTLTVQLELPRNAHAGAAGADADDASAAPSAPGVACTGGGAGAHAGSAAELGASTAVLALLRTHVPSTQPLSVAGNEASYRLPLDESERFPRMLRELDARAAALRVGGYGMSMTSMEEVFLALAKRAEAAQRARERREHTGVPQPVWEDEPQLLAADADEADARKVARAAVGVRTGAGSVSSSSEAAESHEPRGGPRGSSDNLSADGLAADSPAAAHKPHTGARGAFAGPGALASALGARLGGLSGRRREPACHPLDSPSESSPASAESAPRTSRWLPRMRRAGAETRATPALGAEMATRKPGRAPVHVQLRALLAKRALCARRDKKGTAANVLAPVVLVALVQLVLTIDTRTTGPQIPLSSALYGSAATAFQYAAGGPRLDDDDGAEDEATRPANAIEGALFGLAGIEPRAPPSRGVLDAVALRAELLTSDPLLAVEDVNVSSSIAMSRHMLATWDDDATREMPRYMGMVADDRVQFRLEVTPEIELLAAQALVALSFVCPLADSASTADPGTTALLALLGINASVPVAVGPLLDAESLAGNATVVLRAVLDAAVGALVGVPGANGTASVLDSLSSALTAIALGAAIDGGVDALGASGTVGGALVSVLTGTARLDPAALLAPSGPLGFALANVSSILELSREQSLIGEACSLLRGALPYMRENLFVDGKGYDELVPGALLMVLGDSIARLAGDVLDGELDALSVSSITAQLANSTGVDDAVLEPVVSATLSALTFLLPGESAELGVIELGEVQLPLTSLRLSGLTLAAERVDSISVPWQPAVTFHAVKLEARVRLAAAATSDSEDGGPPALPIGLASVFDTRSLAALVAGRGVPVYLHAEQALVSTTGVRFRGLCTRVGEPTASCRDELVIGEAPNDRGRATRARNVTLSLGAALSLMHNATSPHAIGAVTGALHAAQYADALDARKPADRCPARADAADVSVDSEPGAEPSMNSTARTADVYSVSVEPLPLTSKQELELRLILAVLSSIFVLVPFCYIPAAFSTFVVRERAIGSTHLQLLSGARPALYWLSTYVWDLLQYAVLLALVMCVLLAYGEPSLVGTGRSVGLLFLHMFLYGCAVLPQTYALSLGFETGSSAQIALVLVQLVSGFVLVMANLIMLSLDRTREVAEQLVWVYRVLPPFNFGEGLLALSQSYYVQLLTGIPQDPLAEDVLGRPLRFNGALAAIYFVVLLLLARRDELRRLASRVMPCAGSAAARAASAAAASEAESAAGEDEDVAAERADIDAAEGQPTRGMWPGGALEARVEAARNDEAVLIHGLWKVYPRRGANPPKLAVRGISLRVRARECFGLLGVNGAEPAALRSERFSPVRTRPEQ